MAVYITGKPYTAPKAMASKPVPAYVYSRHLTAAWNRWHLLLVLKALAHGGFDEYEFKVLLTLLYRLNVADCGKALHTIQALAELTAHLDAKAGNRKNSDPQKI